jgi:pimeloyl-ACP methyl ester carboxylesterase
VSLSADGNTAIVGGGSDNGGTGAAWVFAYPAKPGTISVTTNLSAASFTVTGPTNYSGSGTSFTQANAPAGTYTITYNPVNCYSTPVSETKTLTAGGVLTFSGGTYQGRATISVSVAPVGATSATFSINPPVPGMPSNGPYPRIQSNIWPQSYTVSFNPVTGFTPPAAQTLGPDSSCQLAFSGSYAPIVSPGTATLNVTVSSNTNSLGKFTIADSQGKVIASSVSSFSSPLAAGKYTIKYAPLAGFYPPPDHTVVLAPPVAMTIQGVYRRLLLVSFTGFGNSPYGLGGISGCIPLNVITAPLVCGGFGVSYPDNLLSCSGRGMTNVILEARGQPAPPPAYSFPTLAPGLASRAFTFYDNQGSPCFGPSGVPDHATAEAWVRSFNPTANDIIVVVGHSYGGNRARLFAQQLRSNQVRPDARFSTDALILVDPVDWTSCNDAHSPFLFADASCFQTGLPQELPQSVGAFRDFTQTQGLNLGIPITGYPISIAGVIQYQFLANFTDVGHGDIDDDGRVHLFILQALSGLVRGPTPTANIAAAPSRDTASLSYPIRVTATPYGTATGFGTATGVRITSASLNGVPASSILPTSALGDIVAGSSSNLVTLLFPASAAAKGSSVLLTVTMENSDGAPYTNTLRQVAP